LGLKTFLRGKLKKLIIAVNPAKNIAFSLGWCMYPIQISSKMLLVIFAIVEP